MILTVTLNSALDRLLFIDKFRPGVTMRPYQMLEGVGGKGFDVSVVLQTLGAGNVALGVVAGPTGRQLVGLLDKYGITYELVWVDGETRIAHVIVETTHHRHSHLVAAGLSVSATAYREFIERYERLLDQAAWVIAGGSLATGVPVSAYAELAGIARQRGVPMLIDSAGPPLVEAAAMRPAILKMNETEFSESFGIQASSLAELRLSAQALRDQKRLPALVITCGAAGILALTPEGAYLAAAPPQQAANAAGAGDGVSAALAWQLAQGRPWPEALRWAAATGAAVVLTEVTAECRWADIERLVEQTTVEAWEK
jgi:1-phosphofructokinase family hexose kinase